MTNEQAIEMMKAKLECMTREVSGIDLNCNAKKCDDCDLCYAQGNMGEQKEWLRMGIKALENQKVGHWFIKEGGNVCSNCGNIQFKYTSLDFDWRPHYCPNCGADMRGE